MAHHSVNVVGKVKSENIGSGFKANGINAHVAPLDAGASRTVFDTDAPYILEYLEWATNHEEDVRIEILAKTQDGATAISRTVDKRGDGLRSYANPSTIINHNSGMWDILDGDDNANAYKFCLRLQGLEFPNGITVNIINNGETRRNATVMMYGRELQ